MNLTIAYDKVIDQVKSDTKIFWLNFTLGIVSIGLSVLSIFYIQSKLKLNPLIKKALMLMALHSILNSIIVITTAISVFFMEIFNSWTVFFGQFNYSAFFSGNILLVAIISITRLHFGVSASKLKMPNYANIDDKAKKVMVAHYLLSCLFSFGVTSGCNMVACQGSDVDLVSLIASTSSDLYLVCIIILGIVYDIRMIIFLKKRNEVQPLEQIPQDVPLFTGNNTIKHTVPKNSSLILAALLVLFIPMEILWLSIFDLINLSWLFDAFLCLLLSLILPILLKFTIYEKVSKATMKSKGQL